MFTSKTVEERSTLSGEQERTWNGVVRSKISEPGGVCSVPALHHGTCAPAMLLGGLCFSYL